jgi:DnaK suppressor protein
LLGLCLRCSASKLAGEPAGFAARTYPHSFVVRFRIVILFARQPPQLQFLARVLIRGERPMPQPARKLKRDRTSQFRSLLEQQRDELIRRLYERRAEVHGDTDPDDEAAVTVQSVVKELALANMEREIRTLAEVELSLRRLATGEYGTCGGCGQQIPEARLRALPWTRLCVECAGGGIQRRTQDDDRSDSANGVHRSTSTKLHILPKRKVTA